VGWGVFCARGEKGDACRKKQGSHKPNLMWVPLPEGRGKKPPIAASFLKKEKNGNGSSCGGKKENPKEDPCLSSTFLPREGGEGRSRDGRGGKGVLGQKKREASKTERKVFLGDLGEGGLS